MIGYCQSKHESCSVHPKNHVGNLGGVSNSPMWGNWQVEEAKAAAREQLRGLQKREARCKAEEEHIATSLAQIEAGADAGTQLLQVHLRCTLTQSTR